ncbi:MAG: HD domain-containing protein [Desulfarculus sp.]|nr:HD domain-containing protein [Desulfarculus sp.]
MNQGISTIEISALPNLYPGYVHFSLRSLVPASRCPCALRLEAYHSASQRLRLVMAQEAGARLDGAWLARLLQAGIHHAYIQQDDLDRLEEYLRVQAARLALASDSDTELQHCLVYEQALCAIKSAMLEPRNGRRLAQGVATVRQIIEQIWRDDGARQGLLKVMTSDGRLAKHCLNVCLLGVGLARGLGWPSQRAENLGVALFFHDLGLAGQDSESRDCSPELPDDAHPALRQHPKLSRDFLGQVPDLAPEVLDTVLNHHENLDGSGYPRGLDGQGLSPASRLARVVDFYESSTAGRGCCPALTPFEALSLMRREMKAKLDQDLLEGLVRFLGHG